MLCSRFVKFVENNDKCCKPVIRLLSALCKQDNRTVYCKNLSSIANECGLAANDLRSRDVKQSMSFANVPLGEEWRTDMLLNLISVKFDNWYVDNFNFNDINDMIHYVSTT